MKSALALQLSWSAKPACLHTTVNHAPETAAIVLLTTFATKIIILACGLSDKAARPLNRTVNTVASAYTQAVLALQDTAP